VHVALAQAEHVSFVIEHWAHLLLQRGMDFRHTAQDLTQPVRILLLVQLAPHFLQDDWACLAWKKPCWHTLQLVVA
jgi:hypothetical protein